MKIKCKSIHTKTTLSFQSLSFSDKSPP